MQLFILAGQSNMSGRGDLSQANLKTHPQIFLFGNDYQWHIAKEPVDDPSGQIDEISLDPNAGYSPALPFALALLEHDPNMIIGLIPCAVGGSSIIDWQKNDETTSLYESCLTRARIASEMGQIVGLLFFQGETDAMVSSFVPDKKLSPFQWADHFQQFIQDFRTDLKIPNLPVVFAQLGTQYLPSVFINWEIIKSQQASIDIPFTAMIITDDLEIDDSVHFRTASYDVIGTRFADAYLALIAEK